MIEKEKCSPQNAGTVEMIVKCQFKPKEDRPVYCRECFQNHKPAPRAGGGDRFGDPAAMVVVATEALDLVDETADHAKCSMQNAETVEMIVRYHSSQKKTDLFIAENASRTTNKVKNRFE